MDRLSFVRRLVKSDKGLSLYKRIITHMKVANYQNIGYSSTGKRYDSFTDEYEYYLVSTSTGEVETEDALVDLMEVINGQSMYR